MKLISRWIVLGLLFVNVMNAQQNPNFVELEKTITDELEANKTPGAAVLIISNGSIVFSKGFGITNSENEQKVTGKTLFRLGSTTKMFTSAMILSLTHQGKIKMDAPIGNYINNLNPKISRLTAHQLLSQSSGLRDIAPLIESNDDTALKENILLWDDTIFFTEPGEIYSYSSANYWLAGLLAEEVYGKPYSDAIAEIILQPLGMKSSTMQPFEAMTYPLALGHTIESGKAVVMRPILNNVAKYPAGSLYSNIDELRYWALSILNDGKLEDEQILAPYVVSELQKQQMLLPYKEKVFYGYGLMGYENQGINFVTHGGVSSGYGSTFDFAPEHKFAIIVLANRNGETLPKTRQKAHEMFLPLNSNNATNEELKIMPITSNEMNKYVGIYENNPLKTEVFINEGKLFIKTNGNDFELMRIGENDFGYEQGGIIFVSGEKGIIEHAFMGLYSAKKTN